MKFSKLMVLLAMGLNGSLPAATGPTESVEHWISLYNGRETGFQESLLQKVKDLCDGYGVPYQLTQDRKILVPASARANILALIEGHYKK